MRKLLLKQRGLALSLIVLLLQGTVSAAEITVDSKAPGSFTIIVIGEIKAGDGVAFARAVKREGQLWVDLDSPGGDVDAAMAIGRMVRKSEGSVSVKGKCYSSCVLIYASGVTRLELSGLFFCSDD